MLSGQRLKQVSYRDRATSTYTYDAASRLQGLAVDMSAGTADDLTTALAYNPASQVTSNTLSTTGYLYSGAGGITGGYTVNGLNQYTAAGGASLTYDANRNLTSDGSTTFGYDIENRLKSASGAKTATLKHDPYGRLYEVVGAATTRFVYDGDAMIAERSGSNALLRRYVHGRGMDRPLAWYEGAGVTNADRRDLVPDRQGSVIAVASATSVTKNTYDEYGVPGTGNAGVFSYTGQRIIPELGLYYYKARIYDPYLGRFLQTDPVGYEDQMNLYAYVHNDPVNGTDPTGEVGKLISAGIKLVKHRGNPNKAGKEFVEDIADAGAELLDGDLTLADAEAVFNLASPVSTKEIGDGASGVRKAVDNSRAKRRAAREAQRNADPSVPTSRSGRNTSDGRGGPRGQIKEGSDGRPAGVADGTRDRNNSPDHPAGMEAGRLKPSEPTGRYNQPRLQNSGKGKAKIDEQ